MATTTGERWHVRDTGDTTYRFAIHDENGLVVARAASKDDGRLLAAAPALLDAAIAVVVARDMERDGSGSTEDILDAIAELDRAMGEAVER